MGEGSHCSARCPRSRRSCGVSSLLLPPDLFLGAHLSRAVALSLPDAPMHRLIENIRIRLIYRTCLLFRVHPSAYIDTSFSQFSAMDLNSSAHHEP